jgi:hypothetical protein
VRLCLDQAGGDTEILRLTAVRRPETRPAPSECQRPAYGRRGDAGRLADPLSLRQPYRTDGVVNCHGAPGLLAKS